MNLILHTFRKTLQNILFYGKITQIKEDAMWLPSTLLLKASYMTDSTIQNLLLAFLANSTANGFNQISYTLVFYIARLVSMVLKYLIILPEKFL